MYYMYMPYDRIHKSLADRQHSTHTHTHTHITTFCFKSSCHVLSISPPLWIFTKTFCSTLSLSHQRNLPGRNLFVLLTIFSACCDVLYLKFNVNPTQWVKVVGNALLVMWQTNLADSTNTDQVLFAHWSRWRHFFFTVIHIDRREIGHPKDI